MLEATILAEIEREIQADSLNTLATAMVTRPDLAMNIVELRDSIIMPWDTETEPDYDNIYEHNMKYLELEKENQNV